MLLRSISKFSNLESGLWLSLHVPQFLSFSDCKIPGETRSTHPFPSTSHFKLVCVLTGFHLCLFWFMNYQYTVSILMLINTIHKGSVPDSNSTTYLIGASLSDILFSFVLEKYIVCDVCGLRSPSVESSSVLYISPTDTSSMQNFILQGLQQKLPKSCSRCHKNTWHVESSCMLQPPKYLLLFDNRFRYINNNVTKDRCSTPMDKTVRLGPLKFSLRATIDHHGPYTASINCCKKRKNILLQRSHNYGVWNYWQQKLLYCVCYTIWIDWHMIFKLEQEGGSLIAPTLAHHLHPIDNRSRNRRRNLWVGCVSSWWPLFSSRSSVLMIIYICSFIWVLFSFVWQLCLALWW